jgi:hypothetical protein
MKKRKKLVFGIILKRQKKFLKKSVLKING